MKKLFIFLVVGFIFSTSSASAAWNPVTPDGYKPITWAKAPGIASFFKAPSGSGALDFLTRIYLPQNQLQFIFASSSVPLDWGLSAPNFAATISLQNSTPAIVPPTTTAAESAEVPTSTPVVADTAIGFHNFAFDRFVAEASKVYSSDYKFIWNAPFFNITLPTSDLSMALKSTSGNKTLVSSGSRPAFDMASARRMLLINNRTGRASIQDFDADIFVGTASGDQAFEAFAPDVAKNDNASAATARLFIGVMPNKQEVVIYCSKSATVGEASRALTSAGVPVENQLQADGGGSASCGYNLPGHYFVEPARTLPLMMGAVTILGRGTPTTDGLNVRIGPGAKYAAVAKLNKKDVVRILEEKNGWYRIDEGRWVIKTLIKKQ